MGTLIGLGMLAATAQAGHLDLSGGTRFPATAGVGLRYEGESRLQASASAGRIPEAYVGTLQTALGYAGLEDTVGVAADAMLTRAPYVQFGVGWRPFADRGLTLAVGHQTLWLEGAADEVEIEGYTLDADVSLQSTLRMLTGELRFDKPIGEHLLLSWSLGGMTTNDADSELSLPEGITLDEADVALAELDAFYEEHFRTPTFGVSVGYRFF